MDKKQFLNTYLYAQDKIRLLFDDSAFIQNKTIQINVEKVSLGEISSYYTPKYEKNGIRDTRDIKKQISDIATLPLTIGKASLNPRKWDLAADLSVLPAISKLHPIPVATDQKSKKTLLLDSNHTITTILENKQTDLQNMITLVRITGTNLEHIVYDFEILNRA